MDYLSAFEISAGGMNIERMRLDVSAMNLANANTTRGPSGEMYKPLRLVVHPSAPFPTMMDNMLRAHAPQEVEVQPLEVAPRQVYEPGHPDADERGFVAYPAVNPISEMVQLISVTRAYEANVRAMNAGKSMALKALEIGER